MYRTPFKKSRHSHPALGSRPAQRPHICWPAYRQQRIGVKLGFQQDQHASSSLSARSPSPLENSNIQIIGLGIKGITSVNKFLESGHLKNAQYWAIDSDRKALMSASARVQTLEVSTSLTADDLAALTGGPSGDLAGEGNLHPRTDGQAGAVFVIGHALGTPGGAPLMLQLVAHLRRQGHFVAVALTRPFPFEGTRKLEQADVLIEMLDEVADLIVVVDQGALTRRADITMLGASAIADENLHDTVRSIVWALRAPESVKDEGGTLKWHGPDLSRMKRPLSPPMLAFLSCPGHGHLGRARAQPHPDHIQDIPLFKLLHDLVVGAILRSSESPFLEGYLATATAVLCILIFPRSVHERQGSPGGDGSQSAGSPHEQSIMVRSVLQAATQTVRKLTGPQCRDVFVCSQYEEELADDQVTTQDTPTDPATASASDQAAQQRVAPAKPLVVECCLLVINPATDAVVAPLDGKNGAAGSTGSSATTRAPIIVPPTVQSTTATVAPVQRPAERPAPPQTPAAAARPAVPPPPATPASGPAASPSWQAMSLLAGGTAATAHSTSAPIPSRVPPNTTRTSSPHRSSPSPPPHEPRSVSSRFIPGGRGHALQTTAPGTSRPAPAQRSKSHAPRTMSPMPSQPLRMSPGGSPSATPPPAPRQPPQEVDARVSPEPATPSRSTRLSPVQRSRSRSWERRVSPVVVPSGVSSRSRLNTDKAAHLLAESLDLPPGAARWRHQVRQVGAVDLGDAGETAWLAEVAVSSSSGGVGPAGTPSLVSLLMGGAPKAPVTEAVEEEVDLKARVKGMLDKEREL